MITDFCGHCGARESHLLVAAEVERCMAAFSGDSGTNEKCCCAVLPNTSPEWEQSLIFSSFTTHRQTRCLAKYLVGEILLKKN